MNNTDKNRTRIVAAAGFLVVVFMLILNNSLFSHVHVLSNGNYVHHAHPYQKSNTDKSVNHHHTIFELLLCDSLQNFLSNDVIQGLDYFGDFQIQTFVPETFTILHSISNNYPGRSPPSIA